MKVCLKQESKRDLVERVHVNIRSLQRPQGLFFLILKISRPFYKYLVVFRSRPHRLWI